MDITAQMVKELRERSGAGMMECKKALTQNNGDMETSIEWLRKQGLAKADKKSDRVTAEGRIVMAQSGGKAVLVEINSETDFVAKDENFLAFADAIAKVALDSGAADIDALKASAFPGGGTVEEARSALIAKVGENLQLRRMVRIDSSNHVAGYLHGGRIGVLTEVKGGSDELARGIAMHDRQRRHPDRPAVRDGHQRHRWRRAQEGRRRSTRVPSSRRRRRHRESG